MNSRRMIRKMTTLRFMVALVGLDVRGSRCEDLECSRGLLDSCVVFRRAANIP